MTRWLLFIHITTVALWLGSIAALYVLHRTGASKSESDAATFLYQTTRSVVRGVVNPSSAMVLVTGIVMLVQMSLVGQPKPFWLGFMEQFGGMVALVSVGLVTWQMRKVDRASSPHERGHRLRQLNQMLMGVGVGVTAVILVVSLRIA